MNEQPKCSLCWNPMPKGEEMFKYHGYSGPCPGPPILRTTPAPQGFKHLDPESQKKSHDAFMKLGFDATQGSKEDKP